jgi:hypothetical protein
MQSTSISRSETTMSNLSKAATSPAAIAMGVEEWFDKFGVEILRREERRAGKHERMARLVTGLTKAAAAGR